MAKGASSELEILTQVLRNSSFWAGGVCVPGHDETLCQPHGGTPPRLSQQPRRSAPEHGRRTRSRERREDLGVPAADPIAPAQTLLRTCPQVLLPQNWQHPKRGLFPLPAPHSCRAELSSPRPAPARIPVDPGPTSASGAGDAPPVPMPALVPTWAPRLRLPSERLMLCTGASPFPGTVLAVVPLAYRTDPALPHKCVFVCLQPREQARDLRGEAAALPPASRHRANSISHPRLLLKPLGGLIIFKVKVKVIHAYFFPKWITPV